MYRRDAFTPSLFNYYLLNVYLIYLYMIKMLFNASFITLNGETLGGPVTLHDNEEYLFRNQQTADNIY